MKSRVSNAKINIIVSLICQVITMICGLIVPQLMIKAYGSEVYGTTASISQFLSYITLLEGGVAGVARAALYKPLADGDTSRISGIMAEVKHFFRTVGFVFLIYVFILSVLFKYISNVQAFSLLETVLLVFVISISIFAQYFIGISYSVLLQANQQQYITNIINILTMVVNTIMIVLLVNYGENIIVVKLLSSIVFVCRPLLMWMYVRKRFNLKYDVSRDRTALKQKGTAFGQHIAYFIHSNTDIAVLTIFGDLSLVAVYSVYNLAVSAIQSITSSFSSGMEAIFGDMIARNENKALVSTFNYYETLISIISTILYSTTLVMMIPFVKIYTIGICDANYIVPFFSILLVLSSYLFCIRMPYHSVVIAAGHFKETKYAGYGEAIINIVLSITLVIKLGLIGVAIGTLVAVLFRLIYYVVYLKDHIMFRNIWSFLKQALINGISIVVISELGNCILALLSIENAMQWVMASAIVFVISIVITFLLNSLLNHHNTRRIVRAILKTKRKNEIRDRREKI